jgi:hypothetical protein
MSPLPSAVATELAKQEAAERRRALVCHAAEQQRESDVSKLRREAEAEHPPKIHALLAIARNAANEGTEKIILIAPDWENEVAEFNRTTDAASNWLSFYEMPPRLRGFVDAVCGLAGDCEDWFQATDLRIAKRMGRSTKTVQRDRDDFHNWQKEQNVTFIEIEDHFTDRKGVRQPHKYRVHLSRLAVKAKATAQASSKWPIDPARAIEQAVKEILAQAPEMPSRKEHRRRAPSLEKSIESDLRRAANLILKSANNLKSAELLKLMRGYALPLSVKPELIAALEHSLAVLKGVAEPDAEILSVVNFNQDKPSGQDVRKETIHAETIEDLVVGKDVSNDETTLLRVPSVARVARENSLKS